MVRAFRRMALSPRNAVEGERRLRCRGMRALADGRDLLIPCGVEGEQGADPSKASATVSAMLVPRATRPDSGRRKTLRDLSG